MRIPFLSRRRAEAETETRDYVLNAALTVLANANNSALAASGVSVKEETALRFMAVFACVRVLAEDVASLPLVVYRRLQPRGKERAPDHPLYGLLHDQPNSEMTSMQLRETMMVHLALWGNAYAEIEMNSAGRPVALWPIPPRRVTVRRSRRTNELTYTVRPATDEVERTLFPEQIFHVRGLSLNGSLGLSPVAVAREAVGLGLATEEFASRFFSGNARPGAVLEHPGSLSDDALRRLREQYEEHHRGLTKAHRMAILEEGMKLHEVGVPPADAQFIEQRKLSVIEICRLYRMQPHKVASMDAATFSNIEHQAIEHVVDTVRPWLVRWEQAIHKDLFLPSERREYFAEHLVDGLLRGDQASRYQSYAIARQWGILSQNEVRELENRNPVDGGDDFLVPMNMTLLSDLRQAPPAPAARGSGQRRSASARRRIGASYRRVIEDAVARLVRRERDKVLGAAERLLPRRAQHDFEAFVAGFYDEFPDYIRKQMTPPLLAYAEAVQADAADEVAAPVGMTPEMERFMEAYVASFGNRWVGSSRGQVLSLVGETVQQGGDPVEALQGRFDEWTEKRPAKTAAWEAVQVGAAVALVTYKGAGIRSKVWTAFGESCPYCNSLDGRAVEIEGDFLGAGQSFQPDGADRPLTTATNIGHPPAHGGCDCAISPA